MSCSFLESDMSKDHLCCYINTTLCGLEPAGLLEEKNDIEAGRGTNQLKEGWSISARHAGSGRISPEPGL